MFVSLGVLDACTTAIAYQSLGHRHEINPLMRQLLASHGALVTVVSMILLSGLAAMLWPTACRQTAGYSFPRWVALVYILAGVLISMSNIVAVILG